MSATRHMKLGVFALAAIAGLVATGFLLGVRGLGSSAVEYHTYFDESVQGLDVGAPVKYRGVRIGNVSSIAIAPDRQHVDVTLGLRRDNVERLGLGGGGLEIRAELGTQGITGVKYVDLDLVAPGAPRPPLSFEPARAYIPARRSLMKGLSDDLEAVGARLPALVDRVSTSLDKLDRVMDDLHDAQVPARLASVLGDLDGGVIDARRLIVHVDRAAIASRAGAMIDDTRATLADARRAIGQLDGMGGLVAKADRAFDAVGDVAHGSRGGASELERTLRDLDDAARSIHDFFDELDREPDMLVKGRERSAEP
jgi:ABC-type transporter Mla subunit MlaD